MPVIRIGDLTTFTGDTSGSWFVMNDSTNTTTYKVQREQLVSGSTALSASYAITASYALNAGSNFTKFWVENTTQSLQPDETVVISDNFLIKNSLLILTASADSYSIGAITFQKKSQLYIGGHMLLVNSNIINDGIIAVAGSITLSGSSTITGNGIII